MPRTSSKKGLTGSAASTNPAADLFRSASSKAASKEMERIDQLFYVYASASSVQYGIIPPSSLEVSLASMLNNGAPAVFKFWVAQSNIAPRKEI
ncbi:putative PPPDE thiol peptidase family protein [Capsicum annuum]|nr:putative PPPDE thiol peptidase family protein [Capsicum annuum]